MTSFTFTFTNMADMSMPQLLNIRDHLRDNLAEETRKRDVVKAQIMYLQREIKRVSKE